jgi:uncharacterized protein YeaO (DUF488 family)
LRKEDETWDDWRAELGPSRELHADVYGKRGAPIGWSEYEKRYLEELRREDPLVLDLARRANAGETITLLCSSACTDPERCHRTLLRERIERAAAELGARRRRESSTARSRNG